MLRSVLSLLILAAPAAWATSLADEARALLQAHKQDDAIHLLRDGIAKDPADSQAAGLLTQVFLYAERFSEADDVINAAIAKSPSASDLHRLRGDLVFREGQIFESEKEYVQAYKLDSHNARALYGIARSRRAGCLRLNAATLIRTAHKLDPRDGEIGAEFSALEPASPERTEQLQKMLASLDGSDSAMADGLKRSIAIARALNGKHAYELGSPYGPYETSLKALTNGRRYYGMGLTIQVGGVKSEMQLDTGAHGIILSSKVAARAGVQRLADVDIGGIGNEAAKKGWIGFAESVHIGKLELKNCIVEVSDRGSVVDSDGLIGTDIFNRFLVKLDFLRQKLVLDPLPGPVWDGYAPVDRYTGPELDGFSQVLIIHHYLLVPTKISEETDSDATPGFFLMDTGSSFNNISTTVAPDLTKVRDSHTMRIKGLNGEVAKVYEAEKLVLQFASFRQTNLGLTAIDMTHLSRSAGTEVMGTIGAPLLTLFRSVTIDYRDGRVKFDYKR